MVAGGLVGWCAKIIKNYFLNDRRDVSDTDDERLQPDKSNQAPDLVSTYCRGEALLELEVTFSAYRYIRKNIEAGSCISADQITGSGNVGGELARNTCACSDPIGRIIRSADLPVDLSRLSNAIFSVSTIGVGGY